MRRVVHCYYNSKSDGTTLVIHFNHQMWVPPRDTMMMTGDDVRVRYIESDNILRVFKQFGDNERAETWTETWTRRKDC